jgi:hypothetical protein
MLGTANMRQNLNERSPLYPALEHVDVIENALMVIRTLAVLPALLDEATIQQIVVLLSVIDDYADQAQTATRNITALLQSL